MGVVELADKRILTSGIWKEDSFLQLGSVPTFTRSSLAGHAENAGSKPI
jgi:hypothetical protein